MYGTDDVQLLDRFTPAYDLVMPSAGPGVLETMLSCADRDIERVVDISGSSGRATPALDVSERIVLDHSAEMFRRARGRGPDCVHGDAQELPSANDSLDAVIVMDAFYHMPNQRGATEEVSRVLAPGGVFAVSEFDPETLLGRGLVTIERVVGFGPAFATSDELTRFPKRVGSEAAVTERGFEYAVAGKKRENRWGGDEPTLMAISTSFLEERPDAGALPIAVSNVFAIFLLVTVGVIQHNRVSHPSANPIDWVLTAVPFPIGWLFTVPLLGTYSPDAAESAKSAVPLGIRSQLAAATIGVTIRQTPLLEGDAELTFVVVMLVLGSVALGVWRALYLRFV